MFVYFTCWPHDEKLNTNCLNVKCTVHYTEWSPDNWQKNR